MSYYQADASPSPTSYSISSSSSSPSSSSSTKFHNIDVNHEPGGVLRHVIAKPLRDGKKKKLKALSAPSITNSNVSEDEGMNRYSSPAASPNPSPHPPFSNPYVSPNGYQTSSVPNVVPSSAQSSPTTSSFEDTITSSSMPEIDNSDETSMAMIAGFLETSRSWLANALYGKDLASGADTKKNWKYESIRQGGGGNRYGGMDEEDFAVRNDEIKVCCTIS